MSAQPPPSDARPHERADFPATIPSILGGSLRLAHYFPHVWTQPRGTEPFALYWSEEQELGQLFPVPSADELTRFYVDEYYTHEAGLFSNRIDPSPTPGERARVAIAWRMKHRQLPEPSYFSPWAGGPGGRICDVGCGDGALLAGLADLGHEVLGIEPDAKARGAAAKQGVRTFAGSGEALPDDVESESFDLVTMIQAFEHVVDPKATLVNLVNLVKPGGALVLETPNSASFGFHQSGPAWYHTDAGRHIWYFGERSLRTMLAEAGLQVSDTYYAGYTRQFTNYWIASEQEVWDNLYSNGSEAGTPRPSTAGAWRLLGRTLFSSPARAYDTVGVVARKPG